MDIETKISRFSETVHREADALYNKKIKEINDKYEKNVSDYESNARRKYNEMAKDAEIQCEKEKQRIISSCVSENKRSLIELRASYVQKVFDNVRKKLDDFFESQQYEQLIVDIINKSKLSANIVAAEIVKRDEKLKTSIENKTGVTVKITDEDFLAGVKIILDESRIADYTMRSKFEAEKAKFNKIKIL